MRLADGLLRAKTERSFLYGKDPGRALFDPGVKPTFSLQELWNNLDQIGAKYDSQLRNILHQARGMYIDIVPAVNQIIDKAKDTLNSMRPLKNRDSLVAQIETIRNEMLNLHNPQTGQTVGRVVATRLSPEEVLDLRRKVGKTIGWDFSETDPAVKEFVNNVGKELYARLNNLIELNVQRGLVNVGRATQNAFETVKDLNKRYSENIEARRLLAKRIFAEEKGDVGLNNLLKKSELVIGIERIMTGHFIEGLGLIGNRLVRSPYGRLAIGRPMFKAGSAIERAAPVTRLPAGAIAAGALSDLARDNTGGGGGY
jgi:hypothetical protein